MLAHPDMQSVTERHTHTQKNDQPGWMMSLASVRNTHMLLAWLFEVWAMFKTASLWEVGMVR